MKINKTTLLALLADICKRIEEDDSFEGSISWSCMIEEIPCERHEFEVEARYRYGNQEGQGGTRIIEATHVPLPVDE